MTREKQSEIILFIVAAIWGGGFVAGKLALECYSPLMIVGLRFCGSALLLAILFRKRILNGNKKDILKGCLIGCVQFSALLIQMIGLMYTSAMKQSFIAATYIVFTPFVAFLLLKTKVQLKEITAAVIAMVGVGLISLNGSFAVELGDVMTLGFAVLFSLQITLVEKYAKDIDCIFLTFFQFVAAGALSFIGMLITGVDIVQPTFNGTMGIVYIVVINTAIAIALQNYAQKNVPAGKSSLILSLESVFGFIFSALCFHEDITLKIVSGCVLVFFAVLMSVYKPEKEN